MVAPVLNRFAPIDFNRYIDRLTERFTGREWLFQQIDQWLQQDNEHFYLLTGEPGVGKSAIAAKLTQIRDDIAAYHFCRAGDVETVRPGRVLRSLAAQLGNTLPYYGEALAKTIDPVHLRIEVNINIESLSNSQVTGIYIENLKESDPREELEILLRAPLAALTDLYTQYNEPLPTLKVLLIDSLDEAVTTTGRDNVATLLTVLSQAEGLPSWIKFILTARPDLRVLQQFESLRLYKLKELLAQNLKDIKRYVQNRVQELIVELSEFQARLDQAQLSAERLVHEVKDLSKGNFLYTSLLVDGIATGELSLKNLSALPKTLNEVYQRFLRNRCPFRKWSDRYQPILGTLTVTEEAITEEQLVKFTGVDSQKIQDALNILQQFLDEAEDEQGQKRYAIFHQSLREYLLDRKHNQDFWCDPKEQHDNIIDCFEQESQKWQDLKAIDLYGLRHLAQHLVKSDQTEELHMLLKLEQNDRNAWFDAKDISSYQADIRLAWEQTTKESLSSKTIALQFYYTLITASLNSLATQIPLELLVAAVKYNQWSPEKGISFALQIPDPQQKVAALTQLATYLPPPLKTQSLQTAIEMLSSVEDEKYKTEAFTKLITELTPELLFKALDFALSIKNGDCLKTVLSVLAPRLDRELLSKALKTFFTCQPYRIEILAALSPHLDTENLWSIAFESIPFIQDNEIRANALLELVQELPLHAVEETWWAGIFKSILSILDGESRSKALAFLAPIVPVDYLESALEIALTTWYFPDSELLRIEYDSQALEVIAPQLSLDLIARMLNIEIFKESINANLENFKLNVSERIPQKYLTLLDKTLDELVDLRTWKLPEKTYAQVISKLAPYLTSNLFPQVVETLLDNCVDEDLVRALTALVPYYSDVLELAYKAAQSPTDSTSRVFALMELVPYLSNTTLQTLEVSFKEIENPLVRHLALETLVPFLPKSFSHTLQAAIQIEDEFDRYSAALSMQAEGILLEYLPLVLELSSSFRESRIWQNIQSIRTKILIHFLPHLPEVFPFAWDAVVSINGGNSFTGEVRDEDSRVLTTREFISAIPPKLIPDVLDKTASIKNEADEGIFMTRNEVVNDREQAFILEMLAPRLTLDLLPKALKIVKIENREPVLLALISALPEAFPLELAVLEIRDNPFILDEKKREYELKLKTRQDNYLLISTVAQKFENETYYLKAMTALAPYFPEVSNCVCSSKMLGCQEGINPALLKSIACYLSEEYLIKAIETASKIENSDSKVNTLLEIAKYLGKEHQYRILEVFQTIQQERYRSQAFIGLIPFLCEDLFEKLFSLAISLTDEYRLPVLVALIPHIPEALPNALASVSSVRDYYEHSRSLLEISKHLPELLCKEVLEKSLKVALNILQGSLERVTALINLAPYVKDVANNALDAAIAYEYFNISFDSHLESLAAYLGKEALIKAFETVKSLKYGDKHKALAALLPYFPESIHATRYAIFAEGYIGISEIRSLVKLAPQLPDVIPETLKAIFAHTNDSRDFVKNLEGLVLYLNAENIIRALNFTQPISVWSRAFALKVLLPRLSLLYPQVLRKLAKMQASQSKLNGKVILQNQYWINFLEKLKLRKKIDTEIFSKLQEIIESIKNESELFYVYVLTELNPGLAQNLMENALEKPLLWDFPGDIQEILLEAFAPCMTQDILKQILEEDSTLESKTAFVSYAVRSRHHALIFTAPYLSEDLFEKALEVSMLTHTSDRAEIMKALLPRLSEHQLAISRQIIDSIQYSEERTEPLFTLSIRCPNLLIEVLQAVFSLSPRETRTKHLANLVPYLQQIPTTQLFSFWTSSLASMFLCSRSSVLEKVDVLAPIAHQLGGDEAIQAITDSIDCVTRWWR